MEINIKFTPDELNDIYQYWEAEASNPCGECKEPECCGCPEQREWRESHQPLFDRVNAMRVPKELMSDIQSICNNRIYISKLESQLEAKTKDTVELTDDFRWKWGFRI